MLCWSTERRHKAMTAFHTGRFISAKLLKDLIEKSCLISYHTSYKSAENPNWELAHSPLGTCKNRPLTRVFLRKWMFPFHDGQVGFYMSLTFIFSLTKASSLLLYIPQRTQTARAAMCMVQGGVNLPNLRHSEDIKLRYSSEIPISTNRQRLG